MDTFDFVASFRRGAQCAVKLFLLDNGTAEEQEDANARAWREVRVLKAVAGHRNVVNLVDVISGEQAAGGVAVMLEYVSGGELFNHVVSRGGLSEDVARVLFQQVVGALAHCHAHNVAHRDLKHQNILTDGHGRVLLIDFGLAVLIDDDTDEADLKMG